MDILVIVIMFVCILSVGFAVILSIGMIFDKLDCDDAEFDDIEIIKRIMDDCE